MSRFESPDEDLALRPLGDSMRSLLRARGLTSALELADVLAAWDEVVGGEVARRARPVALRAGVLVVEVDDGTWATQLRLLSEQLLGRLRVVVGEAGPAALEVRVRRTKAR